MGIYGDYEEVTKSYGRLSPLGKVVGVVTFCISVSSLASLADTIVIWRGFIFQGLKSYHAFFVEPIVRYSNLFGLAYEANEIHAATLATISVTVGMRLLAADQIGAFRMISERYNNEVKPSLLWYRVVSAVFPCLVWLIYGLSNERPELWIAFVGFLLYPICLAVPQLIMSSINGRQFYEKSAFNLFRNYYIHVATVLTCVGILGAVNLGLTKAI